jgi:hypothetical protein
MDSDYTLILYNDANQKNTGGIWFLVVQALTHGWVLLGAVAVKPLFASLHFFCYYQA